VNGDCFQRQKPQLGDNFQSGNTRNLKQNDGQGRTGAEGQVG